MAKKSDRKALGNDPFANGDNLLVEESIGVPESSGEKPEAKAKATAKAPPVKAEEKSQAGAEVSAKTSPVEAKEESKAKAKPKAKKKAATKAEVKPEAKKKATAKPKAKKKAATKAEVKPEAKKKAAAKPKAKKKAATKAEVKPEAEPALERVVAEPDEEASHLLDELMATIDEEVEEAFGPGAMADLAPAEPVGAAGEEQHVIFTLAGTEYATPIANVIEIGRPLDVTPVPIVPGWVLGIANLRGDIISMVDLRAFLGMERISYGQASRMLVAQARQEDMTTGLIVDRVSGIRYLAVDRIGAPTAPIEDRVTPYLRGVYEHNGRLLVVLDFDRLLLSPEMRQFEPV